MEIKLDSEILEKLSSRGVLAYVACRAADGSEVGTSLLASIVKCPTSAMLEGLKELVTTAPELLSRHKTKWRCGEVKAGNGAVLGAASGERFKAFVDDLKRYWDFLNPGLPFNVTPKDGTQIKVFLNDNPAWTQADWRSALNHRKTSVVRFNNAPRSAPHWTWIARLGSYAGGPLNEYNKPAGNGKAEDREKRNSQGAADYLSRL